MPKDDFAQARLFLEGKRKKDERTAEGFTIDQLEEFQEYWFNKGPVAFAEDLLTCPLDVPPHPDFLKGENPTIHHDHDWCPLGRDHPKFRENGTPYHVVLSQEQREFLIDLWINGVKQAVLSAARGTGKTFVFGCFNCWVISTQNKKSITCMGGSSKQSEIIQGYIDDWRIDLSVLKAIIVKSLSGIDKKCITRGRSRCTFPACSPTAARGPHVNIVEIDEACEAEDKSEDGAKAVAAVQWQTTGKRDTIILLASTVQYIHGMFYEYMTKPDYGYKVYRWAIARHISGEKDVMKVYTDKDPSHWVPNVWWITQEEINKQRRKSDEEWLCEALGGASMASGAVLKKKDLEVCICTLCKNRDEGCKPYEWGNGEEPYCELVKLGQTGDKIDPIKRIIDRVSGFDYGVSEAPCSHTIIGVKGNMVFVLWNDEQMGLREEEKVGWVHDSCQKYDTWTIVPDPAIGGKHLNEAWEEKGYAVYTIPEKEKMPRVYNCINHVEKHCIMIPMAYWYLTQSLRKLCWDKDGKIRKIEDHSFDSLCYALVDHQIEEYDPFEDISKGTVSMPKTTDLFK